MKKTPVWLVSLQVPAWQDWGTGPTGQRLGGTSDGVPNGAAGNSDARARALEAAERRQVPQGVSKEKAKEMTEQKQRETWHAMVSFRWWLGNMFGVSWKNCEIVVGWYDIHCIQLETLIAFQRDGDCELSEWCMLRGNCFKEKICHGSCLKSRW